MPTDKPSVICVECRSSDKGISRRYKEHAFCSTCYAREFKHRECPECKNIARLPIFDKLALCRSCEKNKACVRCNKTQYTIGKITDHGPVCKACSVYFREVKICPDCGNESRALSRSKHLEHDRAVCPKCQRKAHGICQSCNHHRLVKKFNGKSICKKCLMNPHTECETCHADIPAGRGKECEDCYRRRLISKRTQLNLSGIESKQLQTIYKDYSEWLSTNRELTQASLKINKDYILFEKLDSIWADLPDYKTLLEYFNPEGLREFRRVISWMDETNLITIDENLKNEHSEQHQIQRLLLSIEQESLSKQVIDTYHNILLEKLSRKKTSLRSIRLTISAAVALLEKLDDANKLLTQHELNKYLNNKPGQKANITGFVNYLNKNHNLTLSVNTKPLKNDRKQLRKHLIQMMLDNEQSKIVNEATWIKTSLAYYHDLNIININGLDIEKNADSSFNIVRKNQAFYIPGIKQKSLD